MKASRLLGELGFRGGWAEFTTPPPPSGGWGGRGGSAFRCASGAVDSCCRNGGGWFFRLGAWRDRIEQFFSFSFSFSLLKNNFAAPNVVVGTVASVCWI